MFLNLWILLAFRQPWSRAIISITCAILCIYPVMWTITKDYKACQKSYHHKCMMECSWSPLKKRDFALYFVVTRSSTHSMMFGLFHFKRRSVFGIHLIFRGEKAFWVLSRSSLLLMYYDTFWHLGTSSDDFLKLKKDVTICL